jgi:type I restriction enzyme M protein
LAVSLGGDADTIGAMTGGIAAAYYGVPDDIARNALGYLPDEIIEVLVRFNNVRNR